MTSGEAQGALFMIGFVLLASAPITASAEIDRRVWIAQAALGCIFLAPGMFRLWSLAILG